MEDVRSWQPGDQIIVSSTDYSMYQAEEFTLLPCPECNNYQVKVKGTPDFSSYNILSSLSSNEAMKEGT